MIYPWQQSQWQQIEQLITTERLPHAMFLHGNIGLGKADFAFTLAQGLLCKQPGPDHQACGQCSACKLFSANTHPDLHYLKPVADPKSKSKKPSLSIRINDIRELCEKLNQTSQYGGYRIAILDQADQLTQDAANSLLKTLEEPGNGVLIILTSARAHRLPVTIRSRCQLMRFSQPEESQALAWLKTHIRQPTQQPDQQIKADEIQLRQALKHAFGSPLAAIKQLQQAEFYQLLSDAMTAGVSGKNSLDYSAKLISFDKYQTLIAMLSWVTDLSRLVSCGSDAEIVNDQHRVKLQAKANTVNPQRIFRFHDQLNFNIMHASIAVNEQLLWDNLLLSWDNL